MSLKYKPALTPPIAAKADEDYNVKKKDEVVMKYKIIYEDDTELAEIEAKDRGYRCDVVVETDKKKYKVYITSMIRLQQDFDASQQYYGYYCADPNMLLVEDVTKEEIEKVIKAVFEEKYFEKLDKLGF